jgi:hypothetical protein
MSPDRILIVNSESCIPPTSYNLLSWLATIIFTPLLFALVFYLQRATIAGRNPVILDKPEDWPTWIDEIGGSIPAG